MSFSLVRSLLSPDDDLRQTEGFKNVSLGNVLAVAYATQREKLTFLEEDDKVGTGSPRVRAGPGLTSPDGRQAGSPVQGWWGGKSLASVLALPLLGYATL